MIPTHTPDDVRARLQEFLLHIASGAVFIHPTDTIYGIGCDATNTTSVERIRLLKQRDTKPFSVIAPSKKWILDNCRIKDQSALDKLPGPYTLIVPLANKNAVSPAATMNLDTLGVRIPAHWISELVAFFAKPIITTSVNLSGQKPANTLAELQKTATDFIIYEGEKTGNPSTIINTITGQILNRR
ncbi:Sua5/YciO/YrdC/YwlC family protein [Candidatus Woesearchaeota archaeon]|nr:MAG: Sua5/YciO/YrdC/YwlC family protein [Candidatus Woesearchaeota archaeon]